MKIDREMDFIGHLDELRTRLIRAIIGVAVGMAVAWQFSKQIIAFLLEPFRQALGDRLTQDVGLMYSTILEPFTIQIQVSLVAGLFIAAPLVLWEVWAFVAPGLVAHERRKLLVIFPGSVLLFFLGATTAYFTLPIAFGFLAKFAVAGAEILQNMKLYLFFLLRMLLAFGLVFQAPLVLMFLSMLEIISLAFLIDKWRHAIFACFLIAAVVTPTWDPVNMSLLAFPLILLYGLSLILVWGVEFFRRRRRQREEPELQAVVDAAVEESLLPVPETEEAVQSTEPEFTSDDTPQD